MTGEHLSALPNLHVCGPALEAQPVGREPSHPDLLARGSGFSDRCIHGILPVALDRGGVGSGLRRAVEQGARLGGLRTDAPVMFMSVLQRQAGRCASRSTTHASCLGW